MKVLVYGVNSRNKGAQLLLAAAAHRLAAMGHVPVVSARDVDQRVRRETGAVGLLSVERFGPMRSLGLDQLPRYVVEKFPLVGDKDFDYILDASGYSLTDAWGMTPVSSRLSRLTRWTARGAGFSMLPQAFGPFTGADLRTGVSKVMGFADRVWARDEVSYGHLKQLDPIATKYRVAPDITVSYPVERQDSLPAGSVVIVPNWNLATRSGPTAGRSYLSALSEIASTIGKQGRPVLGMSHEGNRDLELIRTVAERVPEMRIIVPATGTEAKAILMGADLVISGRYHALVSALSSCVPVVAHSWSHKYASLMGDFQVADGLADPYTSSATLERMESLDLPTERARLHSVKPRVVERVEAMWAEVSTQLAVHEAKLRG